MEPNINNMIENIKKVVAKKYLLTPKDLSSTKRGKVFAFPRQVAVYLACALTELPLENIGEVFGYDHFGMVLYSRYKIRLMVQADSGFSEEIRQLILMIKTEVV